MEQCEFHQWNIWTSNSKKNISATGKHFSASGKKHFPTSMNFSFTYICFFSTIIKHHSVFFFSFYIFKRKYCIIHKIIISHQHLLIWIGKTHFHQSLYIKSHITSSHHISTFWYEMENWIFINYNISNHISYHLMKYK